MSPSIHPSIHEHAFLLYTHFTHTVRASSCYGSAQSVELELEKCWCSAWGIILKVWLAKHFWNWATEVLNYEAAH